MKRIALIVGISISLWPMASHAQALPQALSPYVQDVLRRSNLGIQIASDRSGWMRFADYSLSLWLRTITSSVTELVDTQKLAVETNKALLEQSTCRRYDDLLIELQMERVRKALDEAIREKSATKILLLGRIFGFLHDRRSALTRGANDPSFIDRGYYTRQFFDTNRPGYCCQKVKTACVQMGVTECEGNGGVHLDSIASCSDICTVTPAQLATEPAMCPFATDYLPPSLEGFGCDASVLARIEGLATTTELQRFREILSPERQALSTIETALTGGAARTHYSANGCLNASQLGIVKQNAIFTPLRGPFSFSVDHQRLLLQFQDLRMQQGMERQTPAYLTDPDLLGGIFSGILDREARSVLTLTQVQERQEAVSFAIGADPLLSSDVSYKKLNDSVYKLGQLASSITGIRGFVRDFAYYLRRTCMERPCNARLDQVLKVVLADECFPYVNGKFQLDTVGNERWRKCVAQAGIPLR